MHLRLHHSRNILRSKCANESSRPSMVKSGWDGTGVSRCPFGIQRRRNMGVTAKEASSALLNRNELEPAGRWHSVLVMQRRLVGSSRPWRRVVAD